MPISIVIALAEWSQFLTSLRVIARMHMEAEANGPITEKTTFKN